VLNESICRVSMGMLHIRVVQLVALNASSLYESLWELASREQGAGKADPWALVRALVDALLHSSTAGSTDVRFRSQAAHILQLMPGHLAQLQNETASS
jgi:hypothetical protein